MTRPSQDPGELQWIPRGHRPSSASTPFGEYPAAAPVPPVHDLGSGQLPQGSRPQGGVVADDDLAARNALDKAARKIGQLIYRFSRLSAAGKGGVVLVLLLAVILLVRGCNALNGNSDLSFRAGRVAGYQDVLIQPLPTEAQIRDACAREASTLAANGYKWVEGGVSYDINAFDVDEESATDGCIQGLKSALRGAPAP